MGRPGGCGCQRGGSADEGAKSGSDGGSVLFKIKYSCWFLQVLKLKQLRQLDLQTSCRAVELRDDGARVELQQEPGDGQILSQYARLVWELHGDEERASSYFQRAVQTAPEDSYVLAAHARFLWETEEDDCADLFHHGALASATT